MRGSGAFSFNGLADGTYHVRVDSTTLPSAQDPTAPLGDIWAVQRLRWFSRDFIRTTVENDRLVLAYLRMGTEPTYIFTHVVASYSNPHWNEIEAELLPVSFSDRAIAEVWQRIWSL